MRIRDKLSQAKADFEKFTKYDQNTRRKDTVEVISDILQRIKDASSEINKKSEEERERLYYLTYNGSILIFQLCHRLRQGNFAKEATHYLAFNLLCLDNNLILSTAKYLDWRVLNYVELARAYGDMQANKAALKVI